MIDKNLSPTYCHYPFHEIAMKLFSKGKLFTFWPCCIMGIKVEGDSNDYSYLNRLGISNAHELTPQEMYDHPSMQKLREDAVNGVRNPACKTCWILEDKGISSYRQFSNSTYHPAEPGLSVVDITLSNICNLQCRMCDARASNLLMKDHKFFKENNLLDRLYKVNTKWPESSYSDAASSPQIEWILNNTDKIKVIKATGGEPFYDPHMIGLLKKYIETGTAKNVSLLFHTNATMFTDEIIDILNQFKLNNHTFSIDGTEKVYEYIRHPWKFKDLEDSVRRYIKNVKNHSDFYNFNFVLTAHNVLNASEYIEWIHSLTDKKVHITFAQVNPHDRGISLQHLPLYLLELAKNKLSNIDTKLVENLLNQIDYAIQNNKENKFLIKEETELFDMSRNQSYKDFLDPALVEYLST